MNIEKHFEEFMRHAFPNVDTNCPQYADCRRVFFAGVFCTVQNLIDLSDRASGADVVDRAQDILTDATAFHIGQGYGPQV